MIPNRTQTQQTSAKEIYLPIALFHTLQMAEEKILDVEPEPDHLKM